MPFSWKMTMFLIWLVILIAVVTSWFWLDPAPYPFDY